MLHHDEHGLAFHERLFVLDNVPADETVANGAAIRTCAAHGVWRVVCSLWRMACAYACARVRTTQGADSTRAWVYMRVRACERARACAHCAVSSACVRACVPVPVHLRVRVRVRECVRACACARVPECAQVSGASGGWYSHTRGRVPYLWLS